MPIIAARQRRGRRTIYWRTCEKARIVWHLDWHAGDAHGDNSNGGPNLVDKVWLYGDGDPKTIFNSIAYGRAGFCPAWEGKLRPAKIREVALYVYSLSHGSPPQPTTPHKTATRDYN